MEIKTGNYQNIIGLVQNRENKRLKETEKNQNHDSVNLGSEKVPGALWRAMIQPIDPYGARTYLVKNALIFGLNPSDISNLVKMMEKNTVETSNIEMLLELVKEKALSKSTIKNICADGMMTDSMEKDIDMIYEAKADGVDVNERYVPHRQTKEDGINNSEVGDVFSVEGEEKVFIKNKNGEAEQLKMDRETYLKLFPAAERFSSAQSKAGDCYYLTAINALMDNPNSRADVLQCFEQDGEDIKVKFPESDYVYIAPKGNLQKSADKSQILCGAQGMKLLEHAFGYMLEDNAIKEYRETQTQAISDLKTQIANTSDESEKTELQGKLARFEHGYKMFEEDRASKNPKLVMDRESLSLSIVRDEYDGCQMKNIDTMATYTHKVYKSTADYYRVEGGYSNNVFKAFGYESDCLEFGSKEADEALSHVKDSDEYIIAGGTRAVNGYFEAKMNRAQSMYANHAYRIIPFEDKNGQTMYKVSNPWNGSHDAIMSYDDMSNYFEDIYYAKVK